MKTLAILVCITAAAAQEQFPSSAHLDEIIDQAIREDQIPGAVLVVGHRGRTLHRKAYGSRALMPAREPMTLDTIFDAASLTKVVATSSSLMLLFEEGKLRLNDRVTVYLPEFQNGNSEITVRQLMTHFSGLRPTLDVKTPWSGYATGLRMALTEKPVAAPGERFIYSDINFILLGEIVQRLSGKTLAEFARERIFLPLGMKETMFQPPAKLRPRIAPTEKIPELTEPLRGVVHDEAARYMGGIAGHAGLFTTAQDLGRFAEMILAFGRRQGVRIFNPLTVRKMTTPQSVGDQPVLRGLGWDIDSPYSGNRGELLPLGSFGHTGFTGTSLWIDPLTDTYVILLANSVHPRRRPAITPLRGRVATVVAAGLGIDLPGVNLTGYNETLVGVGGRRPVARNGQVLTGLDVLAAGQFAGLRGKRVGLITNHTGLCRQGRRNVDLMVEAGVRLTALFSPEHGITGDQDQEDIAHSKDAASGIPIWSLYAEGNRRPTREMLRQLDVLVFDIQDVGARFYTYMCTMLYAMEEASKAGIPFMVLDRPNPITGVHVEGPMLEADLESFVGCFPLPLRHGMTLGEIARMANAQRKIGAKLQVVQMKGWQRGDWFDSTGLLWTDPSPNMRNLNAALLYPGIAMLEASPNYSVGRGTDSPFEQVGADWIRGRELAAYLNTRHIPGVRVYPTAFRPSSSRFAGVLVEGVRFVITDRELFHSSRLGLEVAAALEKLYPGQIQSQSCERLIGSRSAILAIRGGADPRALQQADTERLRMVTSERDKYLLYR